MPSRDEQQAPPPPSIFGLAWPGANDEPSGAEQSPPPAGSDPKRAEQSQSSPRANQLPDGYLDATGGWTPDSLMDLLVDELIPQPSPAALERVAYRHGECGPVMSYKMLIATAITVLEQVKDTDGVFGACGAGVVIDQLKDAGFRGAQVLLGDYPRRNPHPPAASLPIAHRPGEARPFA